MNAHASEIANILRDSASLHNRLAENTEEIQHAVEVLLNEMEDGGTLYVMGNGGSAADAQHLAGELVGRFELERAALRCVALTTDTSIITSVGNDYGIEDIFTRQVEGLVTGDDAVMGISTSGTSPNVVNALMLAHKRGATTVGLTGSGGGDMHDCCDAVICVPSDHTPRIQEVHATIIHIMCCILEQELSA